MQTIVPFCFVQTKISINDMCWDNRGEKLLLGSKEGKIYEIKVPNI